MNSIAAWSWRNEAVDQKKSYRNRQCDVRQTYQAGKGAKPRGNTTFNDTHVLELQTEQYPRYV